MEKIKKGYSSFLYLAIIGLISLSSWVFNLKEWGFVAIFTIGAMSLFFLSDFKAFVATVIIGVMSIKSQTQGAKGFLVFAIIAAVLFFIISFIIFLRRNSISKNCFKFGKLSIGIGLAVIVSIFGGLLSDNFNFLINIKMLIKIGGVFVIYLIVLNFVENDSKEYILKSLIVCGFIIMAEVVISYLGKGNFWHVAFEKKYAVLGWGNHNSLALLLTVTVPLCGYLALQNPKWRSFYIFTLFVFALFVVFLFSRSNMVSLIVVLPLTLIYYLKKLEKQNRKNALIMTVICLFIFLALSVFLLLKLNPNIFELMVAKGDSDRHKLYQEAWQIFKKHPVFGVGIYIANGIQSLADWGTGVYTYHSSIATILACFGIIGLVGFVPFYYLRYKVTLSNIFKPFGFFVLLSVLSFEFYSLIDVGFIHFYLNIYIFTLLALTEKQRLSIT